MVTPTAIALAIVALTAEELPPVAADLAQEERHYTIVDLPIPPAIHLEASSLLEVEESDPADPVLFIGTRRGEVYRVRGATSTPPKLDYELYASGLTEVFGLAWDGELYVTQQCEVTRLVDRDGDGRADRFDTVSDQFGFGAEHEYTFGSNFDRDGRIWIVLCLSGSYTSDHPFRGWCLRIDKDGTTTPTCSGIRSPGGVGFNAAGDAFYTENQGPWNGCCSLKPLRPGAFMGHPISFPWYERAPNLGPAPVEPIGGKDDRPHLARERTEELVLPAVWFPYKKMGQSATAINLDRSVGRFGPFAGQLFVTDYTLSLVMRVDLEQIDGVYQGACFPFREGLDTGLIGACLTRNGHLITGGSKRGWPVRGAKKLSLQRLDFTGVTPFEVRTMRIRRDGFALEFTRPVDPATAGDPSSYRATSYTHHYRAAYGSPEIDVMESTIDRVDVSEDRMRVTIALSPPRVGFVHELHLDGVRDEAGEPLLHPVAYYTLNALPTE